MVAIHYIATNMVESERPEANMESFSEAISSGIACK